ncbi:hypothetical protein J2T57_003537 [Natronocella acetinitrilica]|uniref:Uncharacterized protein n=1 Tax=Natronocella acetinitrilica TaxID=414046 RepID=A0AAE3G7S3_9GAMM|nr:hypothetical protein [Natronocella acetinitrilica]MCP1676376.1 hypothetical protein [Natronocella acetinitrilica]
MDLHSAAATIEQVLEIAQRRYRRHGRSATELEAERLGNLAALEQVDHLLMDYWDTLDDIAAGRPSDDLSSGYQPHVWELSSGVRVAQPPSEALKRVARLAELDLSDPSVGSASDRQAVRWLQEYVRRHAATLDRVSDT